MSRSFETRLLFRHSLIIPMGMLTLLTGFSCFNGTTEGTEDAQALCQSDEGSQVASSAVTEADIMEGPEQNKHQFQLHYNDKVICDFTTPGSKMGGTGCGRPSRPASS